MSEKVINLTDANFAETISKGVTLVDFWATWCGPCMMQGPIVEQVAEKINGRANIAKANIDDAGNSATEYGVRSIPTIIIFKDGEIIEQFVGVQQEAQLIAAIEKAL